MTKSIDHTFFFQHQPEAVWEYLTNAELMQQWLMPNNFLPIVGYDFEFRIKPLPQMEFDGIVYCKVLELKPYTRLSYSWKLGPGNKEITVDSIVEWTLSAKNNGTELVLHHSGFKEGVNVLLYNGMQAGWLQNMQKINQRLNEKNGTPSA